jgi:hypothetical protein
MGAGLLNTHSLVAPTAEYKREESEDTRMKTFSHLDDSITCHWHCQAVPTRGFASLLYVSFVSPSLFLLCLLALVS